MSWRRIFAIITVIFLVGLAATACRPDFPNCKTDDHCQASDEGQETGQLFCINGLCQQCRGDGDCAEGTECVAGSCEDIPGYCVTSDNCPGSQVCRDNQCGPECENNDHCDEGYLCEGGRCVAEPDCTEDADCDGDQICRRGECVAPPEQAACQLQTVYFSYDSSQLDSEARATLQRNADCIRERGATVRIEGHCDERGTTEYNMALGNRRANSVRNYLTSLGVPQRQLQTISYGDQQLVRTCGEQGPENCHRVNRRAEFNIR